MIAIVIDKKCVFTHSAKDLCIGVFAHRDGVFTGPVYGPCCFITFDTVELIGAFKEQLTLLQDCLKEEEKNG